MNIIFVREAASKGITASVFSCFEENYGCCVADSAELQLRLWFNVRLRLCAFLQAVFLFLYLLCNVFQSTWSVMHYLLQKVFEPIFTAEGFRTRFFLFLAIGFFYFASGFLD